MHTQDNSLGRATNFSLPNSTNSIGDQSLNHLNDANAAVSELPSSSLGRVSQARVGGPRRRSRSRSPVRMPNSTSLPAESPWDWSDGGVPNPTTHQACIPGPFQGDFAGSSWNATALFASKAHRQRPKMRKTIQVVSKHDFLVVQEAHCLEGRADALQLPAEFTAFWSDCTAKAAGIGILLKRDFLSRFNAVVKSRGWIEIIPGYVAILKLHGPEGNLDIFCCYYPTGDSASPAHRQDVSQIIGQHIAAQEEVLTILCGDFNFVEHEMDRRNLQGAVWSGGKDANEAAFFQDKVCRPRGLVEWEQGQFTHENAKARSRLDRMYCNQHLSMQLDRHIQCSVLEWDKGISAHRAISFRRTTPAEKNVEDKPIPASEFKREGWRNEVQDHFMFLCRNEIHLNNPIRRLLLMKDSIRNVYELHRGEFKKLEEDCLPDDKLGFTMSCLRAVRHGRWALANRCADSYPKLRDWIHKQKYFVPPQDIAKIRDHAIELYREQVNIDIQSLGRSEESDDDKARVKESILRKLKRIAPGATPGLNAMEDADGSVSTCPADIVRILRKHWRGVFSRKEVNHM